MTIHDTLMKKEAKTLLALARQRSLTKVGDIGRISREIESGQASETEIWELIKDLPEAVHLAGGRAAESKEVDGKMLEELEQRLQKLEALQKTGRDGRLEIGEVAERLEKAFEEQTRRFDERMEALSSAPAPAAEHHPAPRIDEVELGRIVEEMMESVRGRIETDLERAARRIGEELGRELDGKYGRIAEAVAAIPEPETEAGPVLPRGDRSVPDASLLDRIASLEERLAHRPRVSEFTSRDPRFGEVAATVRDFLASGGKPRSSKDLVDRIAQAHPDVRINPKDIGNRLTNMGLARVRPRGAVQGKSSTWWIAGQDLPEGYVS